MHTPALLETALRMTYSGAGTYTVTELEFRRILADSPFSSELIAEAERDLSLLSPRQRNIAAGGSMNPSECDDRAGRPASDILNWLYTRNHPTRFRQQGYAQENSTK